MAKKTGPGRGIILFILGAIAFVYLFPIIIGWFIYKNILSKIEPKFKTTAIGITALVVFGIQLQVFASFAPKPTIPNSDSNYSYASNTDKKQSDLTSDIPEPTPTVLGVKDQPIPKQEISQTPQAPEIKPREEIKTSSKPESTDKEEPKSEPKFEYHLVSNLKKCLSPSDREYSVATDFKSFSNIDECQKELMKLSVQPNTDNNTKVTTKSEVEQPKAATEPSLPKNEPTKYRLDKVDNLCYDSTQDKYNTLTNFTDFNTYGDCVVAKYNTPAPSSTSGSTTSSSSSSSSDSTYTPTQPDSGSFIPYEGNGGGPTLCKDGKWSHSSGRGTCSGHGGIAR
jgi:hypothetical protein